MVLRSGPLGGLGEGKVAGAQQAEGKRLCPIQGALIGCLGGTGGTRGEPGASQGHQHEGCLWKAQESHGSLHTRFENAGQATTS
jgi:hypothetical protein